MYKIKLNDKNFYFSKFSKLIFMDQFKNYKNENKFLLEKLLSHMKEKNLLTLNWVKNL